MTKPTIVNNWKMLLQFQDEMGNIIQERVDDAQAERKFADGVLTHNRAGDIEIRELGKRG